MSQTSPVEEVSAESIARDRRAGAGFAFGAYTLWGFFPVYWKWLVQFPAAEILAHRILWSFIFYWLIVVYREKNPLTWLRLFSDRVTRNRVVIAGFFLSGNWLLYIWAVNSGHVLESSLGYFITPLLNVLMGRLILKEPLSRAQWIAVGLASIGVGTLAIQGQGVPWIALGLAFSFSIYGLMRKRLMTDVFQASTGETLIVLPLALGAILYFRGISTSAVAPVDSLSALLFVGSGIVTGLPLLFFAQAARRLPLSMLGFFQYIAPSIQFLLGVFVYGEPLTSTKLIAFAWIWAALALYSFTALHAHTRRSRIRPTQI